MTKIKILSVVITLLSLQFASAQTVLLHEKISDYDFDVPKRGPNFRHFTHLFVGLSFYVPLEDDNQIDCRYGASTSFTVGYRYKLKIANFFALGADFSYTNDIFSLQQNNNKSFPNSEIHRSEKLRFNSLGADAFMRFNIGRRGNVIGRFLDLGVYYNWVFLSKHVFRDKLSINVGDNKTSGKQKIVLSDLNYIRDFNYGLKARLGINRFVITANYRLDELLNEKCTPLFLPRLNIGLEIGLHR